MVINSPENLELASASPRRLYVLTRLGLNPTVISVPYQEIELTEGSSDDFAVANAVLKMKQALGHASTWVLTADTVVAFGRQLLGKPKDERHARSMLRLLSGAEHHVSTAYAIGHPDRGIAIVRCITSTVQFKPLSEKDITAYVQTGEPMDKAGGYGIQDKGSDLIANVQGSVAAVMGLPGLEVACDLVRLGAARFFTGS